MPVPQVTLPAFYSFAESRKYSATLCDPAALANAKARRMIVLLSRRGTEKQERPIIRRSLLEEYLVYICILASAAMHAILMLVIGQNLTALLREMLS